MTTNVLGMSGWLFVWTLECNSGVSRVRVVCAWRLACCLDCSCFQVCVLRALVEMDIYRCHCMP
jgi:hypothetical protein